jgi:hypothetical protein
LSAVSGLPVGQKRLAAIRVNDRPTTNGPVQRHGLRVAGSAHAGGWATAR